MDDVTAVAHHQSPADILCHVRDELIVDGVAPVEHDFGQGDQKLHLDVDVPADPVFRGNDFVVIAVHDMRVAAKALHCFVFLDDLLDVAFVMGMDGLIRISFRVQLIQFPGFPGEGDHFQCGALPQTVTFPLNLVDGTIGSLAKLFDHVPVWPSFSYVEIFLFHILPRFSLK